jgi:hypothetical protein
MVAVMSTVFWDMMPCSLIEVYRCRRGLLSLLATCLAYSLTLKMETNVF